MSNSRQSYYPSKDDAVDIVSEKPNHHWRVETPKIINALDDLDIYQVSVYNAINHFSFEGSSCTASIKSLMQVARCGETKVRECIEFFKTYTHPLLKGKNLIKVENDRYRPDGSRLPNRITKVDIWAENGDYHRSQKNKTPLAPRTPPPSPREPEQEAINFVNCTRRAKVVPGNVCPSSKEGKSKRSRGQESAVERRAPIPADEVEKSLELMATACPLESLVSAAVFARNKRFSLEMATAFPYERILRNVKYVKEMSKIKSIVQPLAYLRTAIERDYASNKRRKEQ